MENLLAVLVLVNFGLVSYFCFWFGQLRLCEYMCLKRRALYARVRVRRASWALIANSAALLTQQWVAP